MRVALWDVRVGGLRKPPVLERTQAEIFSCWVSQGRQLQRGLSAGGHGFIATMRHAEPGLRSEGLTER